MKLGIIIVAAGSGARFGDAIPKQYHLLQGKPIIAHSVDRLRAIFPDAVMVLVQDPLYREHYFFDGLSVKGGNTRQASVHAGLLALHGMEITHVFIHDAARPFVDAQVCERLMRALRDHQAVIPVLRIADTLKRVNGEVVVETLDRTIIVAVQTPQAFEYSMLLALHNAALGNSEIHTDDAGLCEHAGIAVATVEGATIMTKITMPEDVHQFRVPRTFVGLGYDVHRLEPFSEAIPVQERVIILGGIAITHTHYLEGHSDADVVLHALTDAILGAIGQGDIGQHFPPSDDTFKQMDSAHFVHHAIALMAAQGGTLINADITIIGERPKIAPNRDAIRARIAQILGVEQSAVNVKATTTERLGFEGRGEGLAAQAIVSVQK